MNRRKKGHIYSPKVSGSHSTATDTTEKLVRVAENIESVTRIALGQISFASGGTHRINLMLQENGRIILKVRMPQSVQELILYTDATEEVLSQLRRKFTIVEKEK